MALKVGAYIRNHVIPAGMSVTEAARCLGVGRVALSNLLNGNTSLSPQMALKLETAFGADGNELLDRQGRAGRQKGSAANAYIPNFLTIKARQVSEWPKDNIEARRVIPVFLRKLVNSTGVELRHVDFPGYDNAERKGWDGTTEAGVATPWIPEGKACWEIGTGAGPGAKAGADYNTRLSVPPAERAECTFVFVTPRNWPGKVEWAKDKNAVGEWKAVRAYDASDLEQWLEGSIPAQIWLAEELDLPASGFETLEQFWQRWSSASDPRMKPEIFAPSIAVYGSTFKAWLEQETDKPFTVVAESKKEALAFLACLLRDEALSPGSHRSQDLAAIFDSASTLRKLAASSAPFIPVVYTEEAEQELAPFYRRRHCIVVRPRNAVASEPDIALDLLRHEDFEKALGAMGVKRENIDRLGSESGYSPTILRRRLSQIEAIRNPQWAKDPKDARALVPMAFIGAWHAASGADRKILSTLADGSYQDVEENLVRLRQLDDCPVWSEGEYRGVASKVDALFAISASVTQYDIDGFFRLAKQALSETDPALTLPEDQRPFAEIFDKVRNHSTALREGICETLVLLAVHGDNLFRNRLGTNMESEVSAVVDRLLTPLTLEKLLSQDDRLPHYAEAAPETFLLLIERDLKESEPVVLGLLKPVTGAFAGPSRIGLLWALECLAWKPENLVRVSRILARLSRTTIDDNWANKPISSLVAIFRSWMPQTAASIENRMRALEVVSRDFPDIGWQICVAQLESGYRMGHASYRPRWRSDASGAGQIVTECEESAFHRKALDLALAWRDHDARTLGDLVERLDAMKDKDQEVLWSLIGKWAASEIDEAAKAQLRERIRRFALTHRGKLRGLDETAVDRAREAHEKLAPSDPAIRHSWLFADQWVDIEETEDETNDYSKHMEPIERLRAEALKEVWAQRGFEGVIALLAGGEASVSVGRHAAACADAPKTAIDFLQRCLAVSGSMTAKVDGCIRGFLLAIDADPRKAIIAAAAADMDSSRVARLFRCAPFDQSTWHLLDGHGAEVQQQYWREVLPPSWHQHTDAEVTKLIDRLLDAKRPHTAFIAVLLDWKKVETSRLKRLLHAVATTSEEADGYRIEAHYVGEALASLHCRAGVSRDDKAHLEFLFIKWLDHSEHGIPNLERQIAENPSLFARAVALTYKRHGDGEDPPEWRIDDPKKRSAVAAATHRLLDRVKLIPGTGDGGKIDGEVLLKWLKKVRQLCAEYGRGEPGDHCIGQLLSKAPADEGDVWPCRSVCDAMETIESKHIGEGFRMGVYNARRGVHNARKGVNWRGEEGGARERELSTKYRDRAQRLAFEYPYVGKVVEGIARWYDHGAQWHDSETNLRKRLRR